MKISINHKTTYYFSETVPKLMQSVRLYPSVCRNQKTISWSVKSDKGMIIKSHCDALGHKIFHIYNREITGSQTIISKGIVETKYTSGVLKGLKEKINPICFLRDTELTKPCRKILLLSKKLGNKNTDEISMCHTMNNIVSKSIKYKSGSTSIYTSANDSLLQGSGVCQDFAHILISLARKNNFPARYVSGFLMEENGNAEQATHAWVEIFINDLGWIGFDPSHNKCIDEGYVRVCCGLDSLDSSMIKGVKTNFSGNENLKVDVSISNCQ